MNWYLAVLKNYAGFSGRARRKEYWMFTLINALIGIAFNLIIALVPALESLAFVYGIYSLALFLPTLAVAVRRLHDVNKSGWMLLIGLIPLIGAIWLLILFCTEGTVGPNQYGEDPKDEKVSNDELLDDETVI